MRSSVILLALVAYRRQVTHNHSITVIIGNTKYGAVDWYIRTVFQVVEEQAEASSVGGLHVIRRSNIDAHGCD